MTDDQSDAPKPRPSERTEAASALPRKRPYRPPKLLRWGSFAEVTRSAGYEGSSDGSRRGATRTRW
ncbi:MAG TPA: lasso RiPP family leader peptide-containing protein [Reyranella sp.]|nr:lasso RiPP family leader peptide-containing protein [Reyranella sp.]